MNAEFFNFQLLFFSNMRFRHKSTTRNHIKCIPHLFLLLLYHLILKTFSFSSLFFLWPISHVEAIFWQPYFGWYFYYWFLWQTLLVNYPNTHSIFILCNRTLSLRSQCAQLMDISQPLLQLDLTMRLSSDQWAVNY